MKTLYTDASFDWNSTDKTSENIVRGKIAVFGEGIARIEKVVVGKVESLKQYNNIFELIAIARAVEIAVAENLTRSHNDEAEKSLIINTDSQVAKSWASRGKIRGKIRTPAHDSALEYLRRARIQFGGNVSFEFVPRHMNFAGKLLERELAKRAAARK